MFKHVILASFLLLSTAAFASEGPATPAESPTLPIAVSDLDSLASKILDAPISMRQSAPIMQELQRIVQASQQRKEKVEADAKKSK